MNERKLAKNTIFYTIALASQKVLSFFYFIVLARGIGVENTGKFTFALSFTSIFAMFLDLGLTQVLIRETAKNQKNSENTWLIFSVLNYWARLSFIYQWWRWLIFWVILR